jgi:hypothetical protein
VTSSIDHLKKTVTSEHLIEFGKTYERDNREVGISFNRNGQYTLNVFWDKPGYGKLSFMVTDKLGGRWGVSYGGDPSSKRGDTSGFMLTNADNNNVIKCLGINMGIGAG